MRKQYTVGEFLSKWKTVFTKHFVFFGLAKATIACWYIAAGMYALSGNGILFLILLGVASFAFVVYDHYLVEFVKEKIVDDRQSDPMQ